MYIYVVFGKTRKKKANGKETMTTGGRIEQNQHTIANKINAIGGVGKEINEKYRSAFRLYFSFESKPINNIWNRKRTEKGQKEKTRRGRRGETGRK